MDNLAYLTQGVKDGGGASSVLTSTSRFLNNLVLRDWVSTHYLRRNGPDRPTASDTAGVIPALLEMIDVEHVEGLIAAEREINPRFRAWVDERYIAPHTVEFFAGYPAGSVGAIYHGYLTARGFEPNLARGLIEPKSAYEFIRFRFGQIHDFEHIVSGGGFDTLGELLPYFLRQANVHRHLSPELAANFTQIYVLGAHRLTVRTGLNYPQLYPLVLDLMQRGIRIGLDSEPVFMARFEDVLHLTPVAAREALGVRGAEDVDTARASAIFDDAGG